MSKKEYPAKLTNGYYRVREVWEDEASQLGAYPVSYTHLTLPTTHTV